MTARELSAQAPVTPTVARRTLAVAWTAIVPALLACVVLRYFVPLTGTGAMGLVAEVGHRFPLYLGAALFVVFAAVAQYWRSRLAGESAGSSAVPGARSRPVVVDLIAVAAAAGLLMLGLRAAVAQPYEVTSASMLPTFAPEDEIAGLKVHYAAATGNLPHRGDVIVFRTAGVPSIPGAATLPAVLVKRVVGLPGDRVAMRNGGPVINGWTVPSCDAGDYSNPMAAGAGTDFRALRGRLTVEFLDDGAYLTVRMATPVTEEYEVKPGEVFVLGDNRGNSLDSRAYNGGRGGGVPLEAIDAKAARFLVGSHRGGDVDFGRFLRPVDSLQTGLQLEGLDTRELKAGLARCLQDRPTSTRAPAPAEPTAGR